MDNFQKKREDNFLKSLERLKNDAALNASINSSQAQIPSQAPEGIQNITGNPIQSTIRTSPIPLDKLKQKALAENLLNKIEEKEALEIQTNGKKRATFSEIVVNFFWYFF